MQNANDAVFEYLIDQLRQQCEDLAHEVLSLKNQLRDASAQIKELHMALVKATGDAEAYKPIRKGDVWGCGHEWVSLPGLFIDEGAADNVLPSKFCIKCSKRQFEQECSHEWSIGPSTDVVCTKCGLVVDDHHPVVYGGPLPKGKSYVVDEHGPRQSGCCKDDTQECHHNWRFVNGKAPVVCINCGVTKSSECEHEWQFYGVGFPCMCKKCGLKK